MTDLDRKNEAMCYLEEATASSISPEDAHSLIVAAHGLVQAMLNGPPPDDKWAKRARAYFAAQEVIECAKRPR